MNKQRVIAATVKPKDTEWNEHWIDADACVKMVEINLVGVYEAAAAAYGKNTNAANWNDLDRAMNALQYWRQIAVQDKPITASNCVHEKPIGAWVRLFYEAQMRRIKELKP